MPKLNLKTYSRCQSQTLKHIPVAKVNFIMEIKAKKWLNTLQKIFSENRIKCRTNEYIRYDRLMDADRKYMNFWTADTLQFYSLRNEWYPQGVKIVNRNIKLTPTTCLVWLFDDGSASSGQIEFFPFAFPKSDVDFLLAKIKQLGFHARLQKQHIDPNYYEVFFKKSIDIEEYNKNPHYRIVIPRKHNIERFIDYCLNADPALVKVVEQHYAYKLDPYQVG